MMNHKFAAVTFLKREGEGVARPGLLFNVGADKITNVQALIETRI